jgi:hypothetical protein
MESEGVFLTEEIPWCHKLSNVENFNFESQLAISTEERLKAFNNLMKINAETGFPNVDLFVNFGSFFYINEFCICEVLLNEQSTNNNYIFKIGEQMGSGKVGIVSFLYQRSTGDQNGQKYIIKKNIARNQSLFTYLPVYIDNYDETAASVLPSLNLIFRDQNGVFKNIFVGSNNFTNQTIIHSILNNILKDSPNYAYQYDAFVCKSGTYNVTKYSNGGTLSAYINNNPDLLSDVFILDMLHQILEPLSVLKTKPYSFNHNDLKLLNIFVNIDNSDNVTYQIADFDKSSISWNGVRFYNNNYDYAWSKSIPFPFQYYESEAVYKLGGVTRSFLQMYIMHYYRGIYISYDIYTLMYSLMMEPVFYNYVIRNTESVFWEFWNLLWIDNGDLDVINNHINREHNKLEFEPTHIITMRSISNTNRVFYDLDLKLKANIDHIYNLLSLQNPLTDDDIVNLGDIYLSYNNNICITPCHDESQYSYPLCQTNIYYSYKNLRTNNTDYC